MMSWARRRWSSSCREGGRRRRRPGGRRRTGEEGETDRERRRDEDEEEAWIFFIYTRSAREEGNVDNAVRDDGGGISMVHRCVLKNLLMVKVSLTTD